ncbi:MAG: argonaute PAZ domain-containing protein [Pleurocapsa sp. SU_5_0]|nr:argonaute PAZ domain-containing protein [Pleurocapsa sp. SU_5_0]
MTKYTSKVFINRFPVKQLSDRDQTVQVYSYTFNPSPEPGKEYSAINQIPWKIKTPGVKFKSTIITKQLISDEYLKQDNWTLKYQGTQLLNLNISNEKEALEQLERKWLEQQLKYKFARNRINSASEGGFIWWDADSIILQDLGWEVHTGVRLDVELHYSGVIFIEIDLHHRFYSSWTLEQWLQDYGNIPINWVRNTYDDRSWKFIRISDENPETSKIRNLGSLADYHRNLGKHKATEKEIEDARVVYVSSKGNELTHLSTRLRPSITMEILSELQDRGSSEAAKVFKQVKKSTQERFDKSAKTAQWLSNNIYNSDLLIKPIKPQKTEGIILREKSPVLLTKSKKVYRTINSLDEGCFRTGEQQFGCLDLTGNSNWSKFIKDKLENVAKKSDVDIVLESAKNKNDLPDSIFTRKQFWQDWADQGTQTILVISPWLKNTEKIQLEKEALEANIALQFMQPMLKEETYRIANVILGLLLKAKWQPVGLEPLQDEHAAEIVIGFDAGTNGNLHYGTSAFAILANGQSLGWELPEAQSGEKISSDAIIRTVTNIITRFQKTENRLPRRILILRDGIVQCEEFEDVVEALLKNQIAVDLLSVRKSGAGRMAILPHQSESLIDALPGTAILSTDDKTFCIVTSEAKSGGSARPLKVFRDFGDAPLEILAKQVDRLSMLNPASAYAYSRLPYVIHFADKMAKSVQSIGELGILHGVDRQKMFFV